MELGAFSVSLAVQDLVASRSFYEALGFEVFGGSLEERWMMMRNGHTAIGLFQGMFERNLLTFNPGLSATHERLEEFTDVREIQASLEAAGIELAKAVEPGSPPGPGHLAVVDPDGNQILIDQFF